MITIQRVSSCIHKAVVPGLVSLVDEQFVCFFLGV